MAQSLWVRTRGRTDRDLNIGRWVSDDEDDDASIIGSLHDNNDIARVNYMLINKTGATSDYLIGKPGVPLIVNVVCVREIFVEAFHSSQQILTFFISPSLMKFADAEPFCSSYDEAFSLVMPVTRAEKDFFNDMAGSYWVDINKLDSPTDDGNEIIAKADIR